MTKVSLYRISVEKVLDIVRDLKKLGYAINLDFDFYVRSPANEYDGSDYTIKERSVDFICYRESIASYIVLKYADILNNNE